jgi:Na+/H+ antiporter NhaD/arsenite permease-like protein
MTTQAWLLVAILVMMFGLLIWGKLPTWGMYSTGAITIATNMLIGLPNKLHQAQIKIFPPVAGASAFLNNTPLVAMMIPVVKDLSQRTGIAASRLFMPMSFSSILGGASTLIGTS